MFDVPGWDVKYLFELLAIVTVSCHTSAIDDGVAMSPWEVLGWMLVLVFGFVLAFLIGMLIASFVYAAIKHVRERRAWKRIYGPGRTSE